ncbi:MAG: hypothetical protein IKE70_04190 [Bacilli bacterium]|nr:hypothetical protein [Bacilli bacterium]
MKEKFNKFSVPLGLLDYLNPCFYTITMITIIKNMYPLIESPYPIILLVGSILSIFFGFVIPSLKEIVGLGIIKFKMPVSLVFLVNLGILLSGTVLLKYSMNLNSILLLIILLIILFILFLIYQKSKKMNTIAVLTGAFGYLFTYISLISLSIKKNQYLSIILFVVAILLFIMLCGIGIKANLKNPKVHWIIEISNVICQLLVMIGTLILL